MAEVTQNGKIFNVSDDVLAEYKELVDLVLSTESMDNDERQYWFDILPSMTNEQIDRLYNILDTEKQKLEKLEEKYQDEIKNLNEKHLIEWQDFQMKDTKKKIKDQELNDGDDEADDVLSMLNNL